MKKSLIWIFCLFLTLLFTSCFSKKNTPLYDSEWIMQNSDIDGNQYYHHLALQPGNKVILRVSYFDSTNIIVWQGTYKLKSKKIIFKFDECTRYENGQIAGNYQDGRFIKYYNGEYFYSLGVIESEETDEETYHMQLIRPKNQIYGETIDIFGNYFEDFVKVEKLINS